MPEYEQEPLPGLELATGSAGLPIRKRKPGAQPGNGNALRHGFYSRRFRGQEHRDLENGLQDGLQDEINLLRVQIRRLADLAEGQTDLKEAIQTLTAIGLGCTRLAGMLRTQRELGEDENDLTKAINEAVEDILKDWKL
jgi:hypothetical protein